MLLFDHLQLEKPSLQKHALVMRADAGKSVSKQATDKKLNTSCVDFIEAIFYKSFYLLKLIGENSDSLTKTI